MLKWGIIMDYYKFPAIRGIQAKEYYYVCMVGLEFLDKLFVDIDYNASPECRAQRKIDINRIPNISKYILENRNSYVFSSLAGSVDCDAIFEPIIDNIGFLKISQNSKILLNDGQHRKAAIIKALDEFWDYLVHINTGSFKDLLDNDAALLMEEIQRVTARKTAELDERIVSMGENQPTVIRQITQNGEKSVYVEKNIGTININ